MQGIRADYNNCCARIILSQQPHFLAQKSMVEEIIEALGHKVIFYPKFHRELNYIEQYWGEAKRYTCENCDQVPLTLICKFARKSDIYTERDYQERLLSLLLIVITLTGEFL